MWVLVFGVAAISLASAPGAVASRLRLRLRKQEAEGWVSCALEGSPIKASDARRRPVKFGWGEDWIEGQLAGGSLCNTNAFGSDPVPGVRKVCMCLGASSTTERQGREQREELGAEWSRCAAEGESCSCPSGRVRFGSEGRWVLAERGSGTAATKQCDTASFGVDPAPERRKECWCGESQPKNQKVRSAIVMLSRHPPEFATWLRYHLDYMGVERIFMEVEDTPQFNATWSALPPAHQQRVTVWHPSSFVRVSRDAQQRPTDDYETLQSRQLRAMARAKDEATAAGIQWLIHIDDDELLYSPMRRPLADVLGAMPNEVEQAYIPNVEAVYPSVDVKSCFAETTEVNMNRYVFASYANGKAAVRLDGPSAEYIQPAGPHLWREVDGYEPQSLHLDEESFGSPLFVVHFESCPFTRWEDKFWELGNTDAAKIHRIPFQFYRESIERMQHCAATLSATRRAASGAASTVASGECSEQELKKLWSQWKTEANPKLARRDLMPIQIPWRQILSAPGH